MNKFKIILFLLLFSTVKIVGQHANNSNIVELKDFKIKMVLESYSCDLHSNKIVYKNGNCISCGNELSRENKIKFYLFDSILDLSKLTGKIIVIFKDETQKVSKLNIKGDYLWAKLGIDGLNNFQQAILKIKYLDEKYEVIFGEELIHNGHHH